MQILQDMNNVSDISQLSELTWDGVDGEFSRPKKLVGRIDLREWKWVVYIRTYSHQNYVLCTKR